MAEMREGRNGGKLKSGNSKGGGRPKKVVNKLLDELKKSGFEPVTRSHVEELYTTMLNLDVPFLKEIAADESQSAITRIVARQLLHRDRGFAAVESVLDRVHGKAKQLTEITGKDGEALPPIQIIVKTNAPINTDD